VERGLHIYVPVAARPTFKRVRSWVKALGQQLAAVYPELISAASGRPIVDREQEQGEARASA
jgi:DNA primase